MKIRLTIFWLLPLILEIKCERKLLKIENCTTDEKIIRMDRCELNEGKLNVVINFIEPQDEYMVRLSCLKVFNFSIP